jgi:hypothetical protein
MNEWLARNVMGWTLLENIPGKWVKRWFKDNECVADNWDPENDECHAMMIFNQMLELGFSAQIHASKKEARVNFCRVWTLGNEPEDCIADTLAKAICMAAKQAFKKTKNGHVCDKMAGRWWRVSDGWEYVWCDRIIVPAADFCHLCGERLDDYS